MFDEKVSKMNCIPGEIVEVELLDLCSRCYIIGEDCLSLYVYESFPVQDKLEFNELLNEIITNATEISRYKTKDDYEVVYSIYESATLN